MDIVTLGILITSITAFITAIIAIIKFRTIDIAGAAQEFFDDYREEIKRLRERIVYLEGRDEENRREILRLSSELEQARARISILEGENEALSEENEALRQELKVEK